MDDLYLCPDCFELHAEPLEATLGHLARCPDCALAAELREQAHDVSGDVELVARAA
jgi:hypothetical protein